MNARDRLPDQHKIDILRRSVEELSVLNDLARAIGASLDLQDIMETVIKRSCRAVKAAQATITMVNRGEFVPAGTIARDVETDTPDFHLTRNLVGLMASLKQPLLFADPHGDDRLKNIPLQEGIRNLACVPLLVGNELVGILAAFNKRGSDEFDDDDKRVLSIIGAQSAQVLERARLFEIEQANVRIREEIRMATDIQTSLLPNSVPEIAGYDLFGVTHPALQVGGDYFDYIELASGSLAVAVGDVSGKGVPAAMLMANLQATLRSLALQEPACGPCVTQCSRLLFGSTSNEKFATLFYCIIDPVTHRIAYCNAGHEHPLVMAPDGSTRTLAIGGPPAGVLMDFTYEDGVETLAPGELMIMYSDGVTDMLDPAGGPYGLERLTSCLLAHRAESAAAIAQAVVTTVQGHAADAEPLDDVTVMVVKRQVCLPNNPSGANAAL